jgi:hypothetical protein
MKWLKDALTESDGESYDHIRMLAVLAVVIGLALQVWVVVRWAGPSPQAFDMQSFGLGLGAVFAGVGAALKLKPEAPVKGDAP